MKKILALLLALAMMFALAACGQSAAPAPAEEPAAEEPAAEEAAPAEEPAAEEAAPAEEPAVPAMSFEEYQAAELNSEVVVEVYVQATQSWWDDQITVYACDGLSNGYFLYNMACSQDDAAKLVPGQKIRVTGYKSEWAGEVEITDATFEFVESEPFVAQPMDLTGNLSAGEEYLLPMQNYYAAFNGLTVEPYDESGAAFAYKDAEGKTDDLYFKASIDGKVFDFCVEFYLCGKDTDVYKAVEALQVGDVIDIEGFLYWYNGPNPHVTSVLPANYKSEGTMTYAEYAAAPLDSEVTIEAYVQDTQSWWDNQITVYAADADGGYFIYNMACDEADAAKLTNGQKIRVTGYKSEWAGEVEITDATFEILHGTYRARFADVTELIGNPDQLLDFQNRPCMFNGMTIEPYDESGAAFAYKDAEGKTDDLYFKASKDGVTLDFCVEFYLRGQDSEVYKAVEALEVGQTVNIMAYLYWYNGPNPHVVAVIGE